MVKEDINVSSPVPLSRLTPDPSNVKLFQATPSYDESSGSSSKSLNTVSSPEQSGQGFKDAQTAMRLLEKGLPSPAVFEYFELPQVRLVQKRNGLVFN